MARGEATRPRLMRVFHVRGPMRQRYDVGAFPVSPEGMVTVAGSYAARMLAARLGQGEEAIRASHVYAFATITGILRYVLELYTRAVGPEVLAEAVRHVEGVLGAAAVARVARVYQEEFSPPAQVFEDPPREQLAAWLVLLWLQNVNPAAAHLRALFSDERLDRETPYGRTIAELVRFLAGMPRFGPKHQPIIQMLRSPALAEPDSLAAQLEFIRREWADLLGDALIEVLGALDLIQEEEKPRLPGAGPPPAMRIEALEGAPERYSVDQAWMPELVLIAKNTLVWLAQLSRTYARSITRLDEIPDEELDRLAAWGFTGIWLIGVWERSPASAEIKRRCGDMESGSSAYSIYEYRVAESLGGEQAFLSFRDRALRRGIRIGADMVPNHTGIVSRWVIEHPDWFISTDHPPFPSYTFEGADLSSDGRVGIYLEDHYYTKSDAAVVFKRVDRATGRTMYIYHGNDGTVMPWNDTAQLNYLNPEVRAAVMDTILHVARLCPLIRFDAAMTLTKMHYQRLWFPEPGSGGAVPSRSEHALTKERFDELMPREFWREVVDRVAQEAPDTLLLAEAFWLTEGYFVRTLGMHRVYNSAFMHMLREENNAGYRKLVRDTLAFDPEILKRYVNFMNNPDEEPAVVQFGKDGKYFGICTVMVTMPGLPMFGHAQIEGFAEKYGAEFVRPRWEEHTDEGLVARHQREIFPLLRKRKLFAGVTEFQFFDFVTPLGVDENVFVYTNRWGGECALVVYHNRWGHTSGVVRVSVPRAVKNPEGTKTLLQCDLATALGVRRGSSRFLRFRDHVSGLEYLIATEDLEAKGLSLELGAYEYRVFLDFQEMEDTSDGSLETLALRLGGKGVPSLDLALEELLLAPAHETFDAIMHPDVIRVMMEVALVVPEWAPELLQTLEARAVRLCEAIGDAVMITGQPRACARRARAYLDRALLLLAPSDAKEEGRLDVFLQGIRRDAVSFGLLLAVLTTEAVRHLVAKAEASRFRADVLPDRRIASALKALGADDAQVGDLLDLFRLLETYSDVIVGMPPDEAAFRAMTRTMLVDPRSHAFLRVNEYEEEHWFNRESFEELIRWVLFLACVHAEGEDVPNRVNAYAAWYEELTVCAHEAGYRLGALVETLRSRGDVRPMLPSDR